MSGSSDKSQIAVIGAASAPGPDERAEDSLLDLFIADQRCMPKGAHPVAPEGLPLNLQRLASRSGDNEEWRAWRSAGLLAFVRGRVSSFFTMQLSRPALHVFFHDAAGEITASGTFARGDSGRWERCELPLSRPGRRRSTAAPPQPACRPGSEG